MDCFLAKFPPLGGIHQLSLRTWANHRCRQVTFKQYATYTVMGGIMYTKPVYTKFYNSFVMMLGRRKVPRGQRSEQGWFRLVDWDEYEPVMGPSFLLVHRRMPLATEMARETAKEGAKAVASTAPAAQGASKELARARAASALTTVLAFMIGFLPGFRRPSSGPSSCVSCGPPSARRRAAPCGAAACRAGG